ncbi:hypothetical protein BB560_005789 [Smittium megazygosporum]|uniref:C2H2-type domain-containing protein n=1 Tax=Smittium megazygosporum TaxID=133381 RepID=A0A2T9YWS2_9FUNG|nr:hypothetical protein BB560_005789 [Smittium megazygosporum]
MSDNGISKFYVKRGDGTWVSILNEFEGSPPGEKDFSLDQHYGMYHSQTGKGLVMNYQFEYQNSYGNNSDISNTGSENDGSYSSPKSTVTKKKAERKYICNYEDCNKAFTTAGHLARHKRMHTGEKNYQCIYPGCTSKFSRQDNMMQHYRTHTYAKTSKRKPHH